MMNRKKTGEIRSDIARIRAEMESTVDAIREKLSPEGLARQAKYRIRRLTGGKAEKMAQNAKESMRRMGSGMVETIKDNPIPAALLGIGVGLLVAGVFRRDDGREEAAETGETMHFQAGDLFAGKTRDYQEKIAETTREATGRIGRKMEEITPEMGEKWSAWRDQAADYLKGFGESAQQQLSYMRNSVSRVIDENPLAAIAAALALGAAVGLSIPAACREENPKIQV